VIQGRYTPAVLDTPDYKAPAPITPGAFAFLASTNQRQTKPLCSPPAQPRSLVPKPPPREHQCNPGTAPAALQVAGANPDRTTGRLGCMNFSMTQTITVDSINAAACAQVLA